MLAYVNCVKFKWNKSWACESIKFVSWDWVLNWVIGGLVYVDEGLCLSLWLFLNVVCEC